ncbi:acyltransferase family protein [Alteromonas sp. KUL150]|uniref:acyltransferase family protein n=1 Tax=Alteromonas sp. KUL150 TaxID=2480805 RepID=UPI00132FDFC2|nr:acyltransferase family protein [Alteromonas sp. KUL150]
MKFREDINALRAIAVVSVVVFHFNHSWLPGGFAGVDVFFVISGFLMTMIIMKGLEKDTFSIMSFYQARVKRIIPALSVLCFALLIFGLFFISPIDYVNLGKHAAASLSFVSNMVYWSESNYFNPSSNEKWLLHTWSLSVEWQFYLIYPLVLVFLNKVLSLRQLKLIILCGTILAFFFSVFVTVKSSSAAYFLLPTRAWQMLAGGLVFLYPLNIKYSFRNPLQLTGLVLITSSFFIFTSATPWPGFASLLPIVGACMVLVANSNSKLVSNNITHSLGKWSYSIYLWHWPIVVAGYYFELGPYWWLVGIPLSILLGAISFTYIESKTLKDYSLDNIKVFLRPLPFAVVIALSGAAVFYTKGFLYRLPQSEQLLIKSALEAKDDWNYPQPNMEVEGLDIRFLKGSSDKNILVMGASHIEQLYPYVESLNNQYNIYFLTQSGCFVTPSMKNPKWPCDGIQNYKKLLKKVKFKKVLTSFYGFDSYLATDITKRKSGILTRINEYDHFLFNLKRYIPEVFIITGEPKGNEFDPILSIRKNLSSYISESKVRLNYEEHEDALKRLKNIDNVRIIDPIKYLCESNVCRTRDDERGFYYRDDNHLRPWYSIQVSSYLNSIFLT